MKGTKRIPLDRVDWLLVVGVALSCIMLAASLFPKLWNWSITVVDVRKWSRWTWFGVNLSVVMILIAVRLAPDVTEAVARRRAAKAKRCQKEERTRQAEERRERAASRNRIRW